MGWLKNVFFLLTNTLAYLASSSNVTPATKKSFLVVGTLRILTVMARQRLFMASDPESCSEVNGFQLFSSSSQTAAQNKLGPVQGTLTEGERPSTVDPLNKVACFGTLTEGDRLSTAVPLNKVACFVR
jgi:hypothetical protein